MMFVPPPGYSNMTDEQRARCAALQVARTVMDAEDGSMNVALAVYLIHGEAAYCAILEQFRVMSTPAPSDPSVLFDGIPREDRP
jgi:hypothetical protein